MTRFAYVIEVFAGLFCVYGLHSLARFAAPLIPILGTVGPV